MNKPCSIDSCCNNDCRQGRDCPNKSVRDFPLIALVAIVLCVIVACSVSAAWLTFQG